MRTRVRGRWDRAWRGPGGGREGDRVKKGIAKSVVSCETRLLNQGSRLTVWELIRDKIPVTLMLDDTGRKDRQGDGWRG